MDKNCIIQMLRYIKDARYLGPKTDHYPIGERVAYALEKGLVGRSDSGNLILTDKGLELLKETVSRENL